MAQKVDLSIIIVNFNTEKITLDCIDSIFANTKGADFEIIAIDNGSSDNFVKTFREKYAKKDNCILIANKDNIGFAGANNQGIKKAQGRYVLFLNSDTLIHDNVLAEMVEWLDKNPKVGAAGCRLKSLDGRVQESGGYFPSLLRVFSWLTIQDLPFVDTIIKPFHPLKPKSFLSSNNFYSKTRELDWLIGAFIMAKREVLEEIKGWDPEYFMYTEDVDLCYRIKKAGGQIWFLPNWTVTHLGGASSKTREYPLLSEYRGVKLFYKKHYPAWQFPVLRLLLKIGALGRLILFGILEGKESVQIYAKAFREA